MNSLRNEEAPIRRAERAITEVKLEVATHALRHYAHRHTSHVDGDVARFALKVLEEKED